MIPRVLIARIMKMDTANSTRKTSKKSRRAYMLHAWSATMNTASV
jgi:hypothetical protein